MHSPHIPHTLRISLRCMEKPPAAAGAVRYPNPSSSGGLVPGCTPKVLAVREEEPMLNLEPPGMEWSCTALCRVAGKPPATSNWLCTTTGLSTCLLRIQGEGSTNV